MKLDLGGVKGQHKGFIAVNIDKRFADLLWDLNKFPYPWKNNTINEILIYHTLEHLDHPGQVIEEIWRICKNAALVRIHVPAALDTHKTVPWHLHSFKPEWFKKLSYKVFINKGARPMLDFKVLKIWYHRGSKRFWKKYELRAILRVIK